MTTAPRIYFYCSDEEGNLQEDVITLAEGLRELQIPFFGNCNYWLESTVPGDYLIRHDPEVTPADCDAVIMSYTWPSWIRMKTFDLVRRPLPPDLFRKDRRYQTVYMDSHDGYRTVSWEPEFREFDLILRSKMNRRMWHPPNMRPWVLGFTRRILDATAGATAFEHRRRALLVNFGASHPFPHGARQRAAERFEPAIARFLAIDRTKDDLARAPEETYDALMWRQTGGRYSRAYYERLKTTQAVACFCGELVPPMPFRDADRYLVGGNRAKIRKKLFEAIGKLDPRAERSVQWDSFRFWESLVAGCAAFNIDLEHYGVDIPEMPENWRHYIGIDLRRVEEMVDRLESDEGILSRVADEGRRWAMQHYSPRRMAARLLGMIGFTAPGAAP